MESHPETHSVSAVAVIDLSDGAVGDPHGLLTSSVVVIGGEDGVMTSNGVGMLSHSSGAAGGSGGGLDATATSVDGEDDDEDDEDEDDEDDCGCGHPHGPEHAHPGSSTPSSTPGKRKRVVLSIHEKQQVLQRLDLGDQPVTIARDFGISRQQVSDIKKNKDRILAFCVDAKHLSTLRRKTLKATTEYHPGVEQELYRWLVRQRRLERAVTSEALNHKATDLFMQYAGDDTNSVSFRAVSVWLRHFKRAHGIKTLTEEELAKLPTKFTPAMDMTQSNDTPTGSSTSSVGMASPTASMGMALLHPTPNIHTPSAIDDVSSYINGMGMSSNTTPSAGSQYLLQHQSPPTLAETAGPNTFSMLMLSSATNTSTSSTISNAMASATALHASVSVVEAMTTQIAQFEQTVTAKLNQLEGRMEKIGYQAIAAVARTSSTQRMDI
ncbi:hypothetical protein Poli38472_003083 [Pythium oligandrum]|uniref:HTH CENPB-type domain-containing protein n=1 Tax=Pythium oligandrum TaxID=41045 RepID=A0A8K1C6G7_PYTOL|nr:hypothetical protein Poli38472_003083 [Pythium oligandrum]|eukprot:TMW57158.1 hypothetical protein Poli38472_003083 [Pythium oligandrum]